MNTTANPLTLARSSANRERSAAMFKGLRVAVIQFWLSGYGGTERALEAIGESFPQADYYALVVADNATRQGVLNNELS